MIRYPNHQIYMTRWEVRQYMIKAGVIGAGGMGAVHIKNLYANEHVRLAAICDTNEALAKQQAEQYGTAYYTDGTTMLEQEPLDVLYICIPPFCHGDLEEQAAARGIHLMVEKPLGLDIESVRHKAKVIAESGIIAASGYCLRYLDTVAIAKDYLKDKRIGMVRAHYITTPVPTPWWRKRLCPAVSSLSSPPTRWISFVTCAGI